MQVAETPDVYSSKVLPYIQSLPASRVTWVYNILEKKVSATGQKLNVLNMLCCWLETQHHNAKQSVARHPKHLAA